MSHPHRRSVMAGACTLLGLQAFHRVSPARASEDPPDPTTGRSVIFEDSFETLNTALWQAGRKATTAEPGYYGRSAFSRIGGEEGFDPYAIVDDGDATGGKALQISAKYIGRQMKVPLYYGNEHPEFQWISGNLQTATREGAIIRGWRRGYFEARMRFPEHPLAWSAFWLMNGRSVLWPKTSIEIDVVEHKGWELDLYGTYLHEWGKPGENHRSTGVPTAIDLTKGYFRYGVLIEDDFCVPCFERRPVTDAKTGNPARWTIGRSAEMDAQNDVFWPLLTLALRTDVRFPHPLQDEDRLTHMRVDYFRVYA